MSDFVHRSLPCGVEFAADPLPFRRTVAMHFRMLTGVADDPEDLSGIGSIVERTLSKGTQKYEGRALADAFDALGAQWGSASGRQATLVRLVCLPEFVLDAVDLIAEMICRPTFPADACDVAVQLAQEELRHMEDEPYELLSLEMHRLVYGPRFGRYPGGDAESLARINPANIAAHWKQQFHAGRLQVSAAGPLDVEALAARIETGFGGLGDARSSGRKDADYTFTPARRHRSKELQQQYIVLSLPGLAKTNAEFAVEQVLIGVLSGGMSGRLFTEVREKQGLVYWVGAWHEQPRGRGLINLGASTTPERCEQTYRTLLRELERLAEDLTEEETARARDSLIAQSQTEDDLTRARAGGLSDDLFHFSRPVGIEAKRDAIRAVRVADVESYVRRIEPEKLCMATVGPLELEGSAAG